MKEPNTPGPALPPLPDRAMVSNRVCASPCVILKNHQGACECYPEKRWADRDMQAYALAAVEAREADTARLDWIARQGDEFTSGILQDCPGDGDYAVWGLNCVGHGKTFREAIDAAIAAAGSKAK